MKDEKNPAHYVGIIKFVMRDEAEKQAFLDVYKNANLPLSIVHLGINAFEPEVAGE